MQPYSCSSNAPSFLIFHICQRTAAVLWTPPNVTSRGARHLAERIGTTELNLLKATKGDKDTLVEMEENIVVGG